MISLIMTWCWTKINETICTDIKNPTTCTGADQAKIDDIWWIHRTAINVLSALKENDNEKLSTLISKDGIRFSPYSYVNIDEDVIMTKEDIEDITTHNNKFIRGRQDGTGDPINMTFQEYRARYIYDASFMNEGIPYLNTKVQRGNETNNIYDVYTGNMIVEYYIPGKKKLYEWADRRSLTIIMNKEDGKWKVKWIVHGERTI